jgi:hypothetical protein
MLSIDTTKSGSETKLSRFRVCGSENHVSFRVDYNKGLISKRCVFSMGRNEAIETAASILAALSDGARERAMTEAGKCGDTMLRYSSFPVYSSQTRDKYLKSEGEEITTPVVYRKPALCQLVKAKRDSKGYARRLYVLYGLDGNPHKIIDGTPVGFPIECQGLIQLDSVTVTVPEFNDWMILKDAL